MMSSQDVLFQSFLTFNKELLDSKPYKKDLDFNLEYMLQLKRQLRESDKRLRYYENIDAVIERPFIKNCIYNLLERQSRLDYELVEQPQETSFYALTFTFDPKRFHNIDLVPIGKQIEYIKLVILKAIDENVIDNIYGSYEYHKGRPVIHFHGIVEHPTNSDTYYELKTYFTKLFSASATNHHAVEIKRVSDYKGWIEYINKVDENHPDMIELEELLFTPVKKPTIYIPKLKNL